MSEKYQDMISAIIKAIKKDNPDQFIQISEQYNWPELALVAGDRLNDLLDALQKSYEKLPESERMVLCVLLGSMTSFSTIAQENSPDNNTFFKHPFLQACKKIEDYDEKQRIEFVKSLYDQKKKLFAVSVAYFQRLTRGHFIQELMWDEGFNKYIAIISTPGLSGGLRQRYITPLLLVVDNSEIPQLSEREALAASGAAYAPKNPDQWLVEGFEVISGDGVFKDLHSPLKLGLSSMRGSIAFGRYAGFPSNTLYYEALAELVAATLKIAQGKENYFQYAAQRVAYQQEKMTGLNIGDETSRFLFLKQTGEPEWAQAIWNMRNIRNLTDQGLRDVAYSLTKYSFNDSLRFLNTMTRSSSEAVLQGFVDATQEMLADLMVLADPQKNHNNVLKKHNSIFGIQRDLDLLEPDEIRRLVYVEIAERLTATLSFHPLMGVFIGGDDDKDTVFLKDKYPLQAMFDHFIEARNINGVFRIHNQVKSFGKNTEFDHEADTALAAADINFHKLKLVKQGIEKQQEIHIARVGQEIYVMNPFGERSFVNVQSLSLPANHDGFASSKYLVFALGHLAEQDVDHSEFFKQAQQTIAELGKKIHIALQKPEGSTTPTREGGRMARALARLSSFWGRQPT